MHPLSVVIATLSLVSVTSSRLAASPLWRSEQSRAPHWRSEQSRSPQWLSEHSLSPHWRSEHASSPLRRSEPALSPLTALTWTGRVKISGAYLLSRLSLSFINNTCSKLVSDMVTATQVAAVLERTKLTNLSENNKNRYGYLLLKIETEFHRILLYQKDLLLCSGRGGELWKSFQTFKKQSSIVWKLLTSAGLPKAFLDNSKSNNSKIKDEHANNNSDIAIDPFFQENNEPFIPAIPALHVYDETPETADKSLVNLLEQARPTVYQRQARHPALLGLGLGLISSLFLTKFFGSSNTQDIQKLNKDIIKQNKLLKLTNQRIDILAKNVTRQVNMIKTILDKIVESQEMQDIHYAILWNLEQIVQSSNIVKNEFRSGEVTVTLLEKDILNPELINLDSLNKTVTEGLQSFPDLEFPVEINRYNMSQIIKLLKI